MDRLSFVLPQGKRPALIGLIGSGKTTALNLLLRFWEYDFGHIQLGHNELRDYRAGELRKMMSVVSQQIHLFNSTIRDNLYLANPEATDEELLQACRLVQIDQFIMDLPQVYDTHFGENGLLLSGGERQRLAIARAVLKDAPILILDEATANLDAATERQIWSTVEEVMKDRTTIIISHRTAALPPVDRILQL